MKVYGKRILNSHLRFVFEVDGSEVSTADRMRIEKLNEVVEENYLGGGDASLLDVVECLDRLVFSEGEVKVSIEPIYDE